MHCREFPTKTSRSHVYLSWALLERTSSQSRNRTNVYEHYGKQALVGARSLARRDRDHPESTMFWYFLRRDHERRRDPPAVPKAKRAYLIRVPLWNQTHHGLKIFSERRRRAQENRTSCFWLNYLVGAAWWKVVLRTAKVVSKPRWSAYRGISVPDVTCA
jgi:hypothetical protein